MDLFTRKIRIFCYYPLSLIFWIVPQCFAAGSAGHHGSITDLIAPMINFTLLAGFIIFKSKKGLKKYFVDYSQQVQLSTERAEAKSKEAQIKYEMYEKKMRESESERENIVKNGENEFANFIKNYRLEMQKKAEKSKQDAIQRLEKEKVDYLRSLNETFLDSIIKRASEVVDGNREIQSKATKKILKAIN